MARVVRRVMHCGDGRKTHNQYQPQTCQHGGKSWNEMTGASAGSAAGKGLSVHVKISLMRVC